MDTLDPHTPFYCYVVATITPKLRKEALGRGFLPTPDRKGLFWFNPQLNAYFEVSSFRKVLEDAVKRNRAFTDKLQIRL